MRYCSVVGFAGKPLFVVHPLDAKGGDVGIDGTDVPNPATREGT